MQNGFTNSSKTNGFTFSSKLRYLDTKVNKLIRDSSLEARIGRVAATFCYVIDS